MRARQVFLRAEMDRVDALVIEQELGIDERGNGRLQLRIALYIIRNMYKT